MGLARERLCFGGAIRRKRKTGQSRRQGARRERQNMPRSATTAYRKTGRPSPKKAKSTAPKKPIAARKAKRIAPKKTTQRSPKRVTPTSQKKTNQTSVAAMQAEISALRTELQEAHDQLTATAEVLQVINSSPGDLGPVFDAIIEKALALCGADEGALRTFDGEMFHLAALHGAEPAEVVRLQQLGPIRRGELLGQLTRGEIGRASCR